MAITEVGSGATSSGNSTAPSITHGLTLASGDVVIAVIHKNGAGQDIADNNGGTPFTQVLEEDNPGSGTSSHYAIFRRVAGSSEPSSYAWTFGAGSQAWTVLVRAFRGVHADIFDVTPSATTRTGSSSDGTTATAPSITIGTVDALGMVVVGTDGSVSYSNPTNSYGTEVETGAVASSLGSYIRTFGSTGASGTTSVTLSGTNDWFAQQFALKPATGAFTLAADAGAYSIAGTVASLEFGHKLTADAGAYTISGTAASLEVGYRLTAEAGSLSPSGTAATLKVGHVLSASSGVFSVAGTDATLTYSALTHYTLTAEAGSLSVAGTTASLELGHNLTSETGSVSVGGTAASLLFGHVLTAESGIFTVSGTDATLTSTALSHYTLTAEAGTFGITGIAATLIHSGAIPLGSGGDDWDSGSWYIPPVPKKPETKSQERPAKEKEEPPKEREPEPEPEVIEPQAVLSIPSLHISATVDTERPVVRESLAIITFGKPLLEAKVRKGNVIHEQVRRQVEDWLIMARKL